MITSKKLQLFKQQAEICKTMADPKRLMIIHELRKGECSVGQLATRLSFSQANTSQHLAILRKRGVIIPRHDGTTVFYQLASSKIGEACDLVREMLAENFEKNYELVDFLRPT